MTVNLYLRKSFGRIRKSMTLIAIGIAATLLFGATVAMADCVATTCQAEGKNCGTIDDGCGRKINCGNCAAPNTCGGGGIENVCGTLEPACIPTTCQAAAKNCGIIEDGCGGVVRCGRCFAPNNCGGGGIENVCGTPQPACIPTTCAAEAKNCGTMDNGCGGKLNCGSCAPPNTCGGGGVENVCGALKSECIPKTCATEGKNCGTIDNGCGGKLSCGSCAPPNTCGGGGVENICGAFNVSILAARGETIANQDPLAVELRNRQPEGAGRRGFDIGMGAAEGQTLSGPGKQRIHDSLSPAEQSGFDTAVSFSLQRNKNAKLAETGASIAEQDPIVAKARMLESDVFYWLGFDIATGIFGDPALGANGNTATGPGSLGIRDGLNAAGQRGFNASVALHLSRNYRK